jgi:flagellar hook-basal body complex protein FliE
MAIPPIDPSFTVNGPEWGVGSVPPVDQSVQQPSNGFGGMLSKAVSGLQQSQTDAAGASQSLVNGTATDPTEVVMKVERAQLAMQLASQVRNKAVEAYQDVFHTQI